MLFNVKIWEPKIFLNWHQHFLVTTELPVIFRIYIPINNKLRIRMRPLVLTENCHKKLKYMQEDFYLKFLNVRYGSLPQDFERRVQPYIQATIFFQFSSYEQRFDFNLG